MSRELLEQELVRAGATIRGKAVKCPFHDDKNASGGIFQSREGDWMFKCQACNQVGDWAKVRSLNTGLPIVEILKQENQFTEKEKTYSLDELKRFNDLKRIYEYKDENGIIKMLVLRIEKNGKKTFIQASSRGVKFVLKREIIKAPLYNLNDFKDKPMVVIVEGEKCVEALRFTGLPATTSIGGANNPEGTDWIPLANKTVYLWPDNDEAGSKYMDWVQEKLKDLNCKIYRIDPESLNLSIKEDVADYVKLSYRSGLKDKEISDNIIDILESSDQVEIRNEALEALRLKATQNIKSFPSPWYLIQDKGKFFIPGKVNIICGDPGVGKSWFVIQMFWFMLSQGTKVNLYSLEEKREYWLGRALAQITGNTKFAEEDRLENCLDELENFATREKDFIDNFDKSISDIPKCDDGKTASIITLNDVAEWAREKAEMGAEVLIIDPITYPDQGEKEKYRADLEFIYKIKSISEKHNTSIYLVTHPRNSQKISSENYAGGKAYSRFSQGGIWLSKEDVTAQNGDSGNILLTMTKGRDSKLTQNKLAYKFNKNTLKYEELGYTL